VPFLKDSVHGTKPATAQAPAKRNVDVRPNALATTPDMAGPTVSATSLQRSRMPNARPFWLGGVPSVTRTIVIVVPRPNPAPLRTTRKKSATALGENGTAIHPKAIQTRPDIIKLRRPSRRVSGPKMGR